MSVRQSLLAILDQGPCYGYQLRSEFDRRTGSTWPLNVGQIYNTLDRLERDGLVEKGQTDAQGHVFWQITDAGSAEVRDWLAAPVERAAGTRDELAIKLAVAATLPGVAVSAIFSFIFSWNELLFALVLTRRAVQTAPVAATSFMSGYELPWGKIMATGTLIVLPVTIFALLVSRHMIRGLTMGASK